MALTGSTIASTYLKLLRANSDTMGADATASYIQDSADTDSVLSISTTRVGIGNAAPASVLHLTGTMQVGVDDAGHDVIFYGNTASSNMTWDTSEDDLVLNDSRLLIDQDDNVDSIVVDTEATSAHGLTIAGDALTTGSASTFSTTSTALASTATGGLVEISSTGDTDTNVNNLLYIVNDHADSAGTTALKIKQDSTGPAIDVGGGYMVNEQGRQDHVANTMSAPYYRFDGVNDGILNTPGTWPITGFPLSLMVSFRTESTGGTALCGLYPSDENLYQVALAINEGSAGNISLRSRNESNLVEHSTSAIYNDGKWHTAVGVWVSSTLRYLYIDGVLDSTHTGTGTYHTSLDRIACGYEADSGPGGYYEGEISKYQVYNFALSASEVKELYSGTSVPFKYKGPSGVEQVTNGDCSTDSFAKESNWTYDATNDEYDGNTSSGDAIKQDNVITKYKSYRVTFEIKNYVSGGVKPNVGGYISGTTLRTANGTYTEVITASHVSSNAFLYIIADASGFEGSVDNISCVPIGAVAEYDGSGVGKLRWDDKSGNDFHATVSGATVENAPADADSGLTYEEGTWTPVINAGGTSLGALTQEECVYTKIGNRVFFNGWINGMTKNAETGDITIGGLPFTVGSEANGGYAPVSHWAYSGISFANMLILRVNANETAFILQETTEGGVGSGLTEANIANGINFMFSGHYIVA